MSKPAAPRKTGRGAASLSPRIAARTGHEELALMARTHILPTISIVALTLSAEVAAQSTTRVSVSSSGAQGNQYSEQAAISGDGRFVAFSSVASTLIANDTNNSDDIFVHDRQTGATTRVSVSTTGGDANQPSRYPDISTDGRWVVFASTSSNIVAGDANGMLLDFFLTYTIG